MTAAIAIYAAVISTFAAGWQAYTWTQQGKTRIRVWLTLEEDVLFAAVNEVTLSGDRIPVTVINETERPVRVTKAVLRSQQTDTLDDLRHPLVPVIPPHDSVEATLTASSAKERGFSVREPIYSEITTAAGETFRSNKIRLTK